MRPWQPFWWPAGTELTVTLIRLGMRVYLAVHGELQVPRLLGSCAPDSVLGFSGPLNRGDSLEVQPGPLQLAHCPLGIPVLRSALAPPRLADHLLIPVTDGPDRDQFGASAERLHAGRFVIGDRSNHIGCASGPSTAPSCRCADAATRCCHAGFRSARSRCLPATN